MNFDFKSFTKKIIFLILLILFSNASLYPITALISSLETLKTKLIALTDVIGGVKKKEEPKKEEIYDPDKLITREDFRFFFGSLTRRKDFTDENFANYKKQAKTQFTTFAQKFDHETKSPGLAGYLLKKIDTDEAQSLGLEWCTCQSAPPFKRANFLLVQLQDIIQNTDKEKLFIHTEFAELQCAQIYYMTCGLLKYGYRKIHLNLIGEMKQLDAFRDTLEKAVDKECEKQGIKKEDVSITIHSFAGDDWNNEVKQAFTNNPDFFSCQSFAMVDPSDGFDIKNLKDFYRFITMVQEKSPYKNPFIFVFMDDKIWKTQTPDHLILFASNPSAPFRDGIKRKEEYSDAIPSLKWFAKTKEEWLNSSKKRESFT